MDTGNVSHNERVPLSFVKAVLLQARSYGKPIEPMLREAGFAGNPLAGEGGDSVSMQQYSRLCLALFRSIDDESGGFLPGVATPLGGTRLLAYSMLHCRDLEQALRRAIEFNVACRERSTAASRHSLECLADGKTARLAYAAATTDRPGSQVAMLYSLAIWLRFCAWLIDQPIEFLAAGCAGREPQNRAGIDHFFHCPIRFEQEYNWVDFPQSVLRAPIRRDETALESFLKVAPYHVVIKPLLSDDTVSARIRRLLGDDFRRETPAFDDLARQLHMSERTLRRRLDAEGASYQRIKDTARRDAAIEYLANPELTVSDVAELLGFSDPSAFHRSFKRWTGRSPGEYRQLGR